MFPRKGILHPLLPADIQAEAEEAKGAREEKAEVRPARLQERSPEAVRPEMGLLDQLPMQADVQQPAQALHAGQLDSTLEVLLFHTALDSYPR